MGEESTGAFVNTAQKIEIPSTSVALADLDGDGDLDSFLVSLENPSVWLNDGFGKFSLVEQPLLNVRAFDVRVGDLDGDGDDDAFVAVDGPNRIWLNDGRGTFVDSDQRLGNSKSRCLELLDVELDGDLDAFVGNDKSPNKIWPNDGTGIFLDSGQSLGEGSSRWADFGDLNQDGCLDIIIASRPEGSQVWVNQGDGRFLPSGQTLPGGIKVSLGDLDGDGDLDAWLVRKYRLIPDDRILWNDGTGQFFDSGVGYENTSGTLGDFNGDSNLDVWHIRGDGVGSMFNDGGGNFELALKMVSGERTLHCALGDLNGDGRLDVWAAGARKSEVWINGGRAMIHRIKEADDNAISIDYTGSLFYSPEVNGEYRIVENAYSPYAVQRMGLKGFYLVR